MSSSCFYLRSRYEWFRESQNWKYQIPRLSTHNTFLSYVPSWKEICSIIWWTKRQIYLAKTLPDMHSQFSGDLTNSIGYAWTYFVNSFTKVIIHFPARRLITFVSISMRGVSILQFSFIQETVHCKDRAQFLNL